MPVKEQVRKSRSTSRIRRSTAKDQGTFRLSSGSGISGDQDLQEPGLLELISGPQIRIAEHMSSAQRLVG